jgi:preprotein translocase subunit YajC
MNASMDSLQEIFFLSFSPLFFFLPSRKKEKRKKEKRKKKNEKKKKAQRFTNINRRFGGTI